MRNEAVAAIVAMLLLASACRPAAYEQTIKGVLTSADKPMPGTLVRFLNTEPKMTCSGGAEGVTDQEGHFQFSSLYIPEFGEAFAVFIHPYSLCAKLGDDWVSLWKFTSGPAPAKIDFRCDLGRRGDDRCEWSWNGEKWQSSTRL